MARRVLGLTALTKENRFIPGDETGHARVAAESGQLPHRPPVLTKVPMTGGLAMPAHRPQAPKVFALPLRLGESSQSPAPGP